MTRFWVRATHSVKRIFSLQCLFVALVVSHFGFEDWTLVLIASVTGQCIPVTFHTGEKPYATRFQHDFKSIITALTDENGFWKDGKREFITVKHTENFQ